MGGKINLLKSIYIQIGQVFILLLFSFAIYAETPTKAPGIPTTNTILLEQNKKILIDEMNFKDAKDLNPIEIRTHVLDAIMITKNFTILSGKHKGLVNNNYHNYYTINFKFKDAGPNIEVDLNLLNWVTQFKHRQMTKSLNKKNFLFNFRLSVYQLIYGEQYVWEHQTELESLTSARVNALKSKNPTAQQIKQSTSNSKYSQNKKNNATSDNQVLQKSAAPKSDLALQAVDAKPKAPAKEIIPRFVPLKDVSTQTTNENSSTKNKSVEKNDKETAGVADKVSESISNTNSNENNSQEDEEDTSRFEKAPEIYYLKKAAKNKKKNKKLPESKIKEVYVSKGDTLFPVLPKEITREERKAIADADMINYLNMTIKLIDEFTESKALINVSTHLTFFAAGVDFATYEQSETPLVYHIKSEFGVPVQKNTEKFIIPTWKRLLVGAVSRDFGEVMSVGGYIEYGSIYFVNLKTPGEGLVIEDNNMIWAQLYLGKEFFIFDFPFNIHATIAQSITFISPDSSTTLSGQKLCASFLFPIWTKIGAEIQYQSFGLKGQQNQADITLDSVNSSLSLRYAF